MGIKQKINVTVKPSYKIHLYLIMLVCRFSSSVSIKYYEWFFNDLKNNTEKYIKYEVGH